MYEVYLSFKRDSPATHQEFLLFPKVVEKEKPPTTAEDLEFLGKHRKKMIESLCYVREDSDKNWTKLLIRNRIKSLVQEVVEGNMKNKIAITNMAYGQVLISAASNLGIPIRSLDYTFFEWETTCKQALKEMGIKE